jgi:hypothetical protein
VETGGPTIRQLNGFEHVGDPRWGAALSIRPVPSELPANDNWGVSDPGGIKLPNAGRGDRSDKSKLDLRKGLTS